MLLMNRVPLMPAFAQMRDEFDQLFNTALSNLSAVRTGSPAMNVWEDDQTYFIEAELPGTVMGDIELSVLDDEVTIKGSRTITTPEQATYLRRERSAGTFTRTFTLPAPVQADKVEASLTNGVLLVKLPKSAKALPRKITVKG